MKKILIFIILSAITFSAYAETGGIGTMNIQEGTPPDPFVFADSHYTILRSDKHNAYRIDDGFCLNMPLTREVGVPDNDEEEPTGNLMVTSDVYLQEAGFYSYTENGLITHDLSEDSRYNYSQPWTEPEAMRGNPSITGHKYYIGINHNFRDTPVALYEHDMGAFDLIRQDFTSSTGYERQNIEVIVYTRNKPHWNSIPTIGTHVIFKDENGATPPSDPNNPSAIPTIRNFLGCYSVEDAANPNERRNLWLASFNFTSKYPGFYLGDGFEHKIRTKIYNPQTLTYFLMYNFKLQ